MHLRKYKDVKHEIGSYFLNLALYVHSNKICIYILQIHSEINRFIDKTNFLLLAAKSYCFILLQNSLSNRRLSSIMLTYRYVR